MSGCRAFNSGDRIKMATRTEDYLGIDRYNVIGTRPIRHDGTDKVTGRAKYGADTHTSGVLIGKTLRSPHAHARILSIDTGAARALPGVKAVMTGADLAMHYEDKVANIGEGSVSLPHLVTNVLASDKVLYEGHAVAAVAATSGHVAEEALGLIHVEYEVLEPVLDVRPAMEDGAPLLHEAMRVKSLGQSTDKPGNIANHFQHTLGDIDQGFAEADIVIEREFSTQTVHQGYIEPHNVTAYWNLDDQITVWTSTQGPFEVRDQVADILGVPTSSVRVVPAEIGGGFGGKFRVYQEPTAAFMSRMTGKPVKMVMSRTEVLKATGPTPGSYMTVKMGATKDGRLVAAQAYLAYEAGAYPGSPVGAGAGCIFSPYDIPNVVIDGYDVVVNKPQTSAYRAPGATNGAFAAETVIDEICEILGTDPLEFRLNNSAKEGSRRADGPVFPRIGHDECVRAAITSDHYQSMLDGPNRGRGVASGFWFNGGGTSTVVVSVNGDGTVNLVEGSPDIGGTRTSIAMQAAEVLGIPAEQVKPMVVDTDAIGQTDGTGGSRVTFATGWAGYEAAEDVKRQMVARAARLWEIPDDDVAFDGGVFRSRSAPEKSITFTELAGKLGATGGPVVGRAAVAGKAAGPAYAVMVVDVEVDPDTGKVDILRVTIVQDAGKAIHPAYVEGQMQGGVAQGIGWALNEEYFYNDKGDLVNASLLDYRMPTCLDLPMIETVIVEVPNPGHPYGVRGVGEVPIVPPPAAVANAIYDAVGVRLRDLPMSPGRVLETIFNNNGGGSGKG